MKLWITTDKETRREIEIGEGCVIELAGRDAEHPNYEPRGIGTPWGFITHYYDNNSRMYAMKIDSDTTGMVGFGQVSPMNDPMPGEKK